MSYFLCKKFAYKNKIYYICDKKGDRFETIGEGLCNDLPLHPFLFLNLALKTIAK